MEANMKALATPTKIAIVALNASLLASCASQPTGGETIGAWVGYQEQKLSDSSYQLSYTNRSSQADEQAGWQQVEGLWHQRAKELCSNGQYDSSEMIQSKPCRTHYVVYGKYLRRESTCLMELSGLVDCK